MTIISLADFKKEREAAALDGPMCITFFGAKFTDPTGRDVSLTIRWTVNDGDVFGALESVNPRAE